MTRERNRGVSGTGIWGRRAQFEAWEKTHAVEEADDSSCSISYRTALLSNMRLTFECSLEGRIFPGQHLGLLVGRVDRDTGRSMSLPDPVQKIRPIAQYNYRPDFRSSSYLDGV
jgi:hypothetical protein